MKFDAPEKSPAHLALLMAAADAGVDVEALRRLLWLINAHPRLIAHGQVFANIESFLGSFLCDEAALTWAEVWKQDIPTWLDACQWIRRDTHKLIRLEGLCEFDKRPTGSSDNPHLHKGVTRHAVVAALWSRHEESPNYPPSATQGCTPQASERFFQLQTHLFLVIVDSRFRFALSVPDRGQQFYETYSEEAEAPVAPSSSTAVGLAVRELSHAKYAPLFAHWPHGCSTDSVAILLDATSLNVSSFGAVEWASDAARYWLNICRFFRRHKQMLDGGMPSQNRRRAGGGAGGGRNRRPGFIHLDSVAGVYLVKAQQRPEDEDFPHLPADTVYLDFDSELDDDDRLVEASGLSPHESLEPVFALFAPDELQNRLATMRWQERAIEMQAQFLPFAYTTLTSTEKKLAFDTFDDAVKLHLSNSESITNKTEARYAAIAGLLLVSMWFLGQRLDAVRQMHYEWRTRNDNLTSGGLEVNHPTLIILADEKGVWDSATAGGFWLPAIQPHYKTDLPEELNDFNRHQALCVWLPDHLGLGQRLVSFLKLENRPNNLVFGIDPKTAKKIVAASIRRTDLDRLSPEKLSRDLEKIIVRQTGDPSLAWCVLADVQEADQPRMHYTRHKVSKLRDAYAKATHTLSRDIGIAFTKPGPATQTGGNITESVGARFVVRMDDLHSLIESLRGRLMNGHRIPQRGDEIVSYHHAYVLYVWLFQSLTTSMRAINRPNHLYRSWENRSNVARTASSSITTSLSDKDTTFCEKARLLHLPGALSTQFSYYQQHIYFLLQRLNLRPAWAASPEEDLPLCCVDDNKKLIPLKPIWVEEQLGRLGLPMPANFHRALLRTELLARGCLAQVVDAFLGHANIGESPFGRYSSFDFDLHHRILDPALEAIRFDLGLFPIQSRLVSYANRT